MYEIIRDTLLFNQMFQYRPHGAVAKVPAIFVPFEGWRANESCLISVVMSAILLKGGLYVK